MTDAGVPEDRPAVGEVLFALDPDWEPTDGEPEMPRERVVGGWVVDVEGQVGRFQSNPDYVPVRPGAPTDPLDALLQRLVRGAAAGDELIAALDMVDLGVALDADGDAVVTVAPDGDLVVAVTSSLHHRHRVEASDWREVGVAELASALPEHGVDVLLNPGAPASMRVPADTIRSAAAAQGSIEDVHGEGAPGDP